MEELARHRAGRLKVALLNADKEFLFAQGFGLKGVPKFILYRKGERVAVLDGAPTSKGQLFAWIDRSLSGGEARND